MTDIKLSLPITAVIAAAASIGTGVLTMRVHEATLTAKLDGLEQRVSVQQSEMRSLTSQREFEDFRQYLDRQLTDIQSRLMHIDEKVSTR